MKTTGSALAVLTLLLLLQSMDWVIGNAIEDAAKREEYRLAAEAYATELRGEDQHKTPSPEYYNEETAKWLADLERRAIEEEEQDQVARFDHEEPGDADYSDDIPEDEGYEDKDDAAHEEHRRLEQEEASTDPVGNEEEEATDTFLIPGLRDVDLAAFNAEFAQRDVLEKVITWAHDRTAEISRHRDNFVHADDLYELLLHTLNPLGEQIEDDEQELLEEAVRTLRKQQGLHDDDMIVHRGFIARGMPLRFLQSVAHDIHHHVRTRRLQATDGHQEL